MENLLIIMIVLMVYLANMLICAIINVVNYTRTPNSFKDFCKLTFLPWLILNLKKVRN